MMRRLLHSLLGNTAGATAVEFALVAGPLLLMVFGTVEFARLQWTREALQSAAIAGARCMGVKQESCAPNGTYSPDQTIAFVKSRANALYVSFPDAAITLDPGATCAGAEGFAQVTIDHTFQSVVSGVLTMLTEGVALSATACFPNQA